MSEVVEKHTAMVLALAKPGQEILSGLDPLKCDLWHHVTGVVTEAGELLQFEDDENLKEELGDLDFYLTGVRENLVLERSTVLVESFHGGAGDHERLCFWACELLDMVKKVVIYGQVPDRNRAQEIVYNIEQYIMAICAFRGITREDCLEANMAKLAKRYPNFEYTDQRAKERADKEEADKRFGQPHYGH